MPGHMMCRSQSPVPVLTEDCGTRRNRMSVGVAEMTGAIPSPRADPDFPGSHAPEAVKELVKNVIKSLIHHEDHEGHEEKIKSIKSLKLRALRVLRG